MNTFLAARPARPLDADAVFSVLCSVLPARADGPATPDYGIDIAKLSLDVHTTNGKIVQGLPRNIGADVVRLLGQIRQSREALWRNPVKARVATWGRRELMHVFNGMFRQSITDYETYETFGKCYTCPDPYRNDDPPWESCFCI